ncbi:MAG TPA: right-handed parallel beta-helix repeat-containing protein, partial [Terriglobia bacterium]|nr:right-handed parallel beta-helix repeat-containing protein [Terriglobia bacterium]
GFCGVYLRQETLKNSGHRNTFKENKILNNGSQQQGYGFYIDPYAGDTVITNNRIAETRSGADRTQRYGVYKAAHAGSVQMQGNTTEGNTDYYEAKK